MQDSNDIFLRNFSSDYTCFKVPKFIKISNANNNPTKLSEMVSLGKKSMNKS